VRRVGNLDFPFRFSGNLRLRHDTVASFPSDNLHYQVQMVSHFSHLQLSFCWHSLQPKAPPSRKRCPFFPFRRARSEVSSSPV
jgi:hypothetical protein